MVRFLYGSEQILKLLNTWNLFSKYLNSWFPKFVKFRNFLSINYDMDYWDFYNLEIFKR
jgi:hypothetical protein